MISESLARSLNLGTDQCLGMSFRRTGSNDRISFLAVRTSRRNLWCCVGMVMVNGRAGKLDMVLAIEIAEGRVSQTLADSSL
jgi:hypothetical protein